MNLKGFFKECHEKEVFKMLSIYVVSSWVILQVLALVADPLNFPKKSVTYHILVLLIGFPIYIYYLWKFHLKKLEKPQEGDTANKFYKSSFQKMYFSSLAIISTIVAVASLMIINTNLIEDFAIDDIQSTDKIAVQVFTNNTGDKKLDFVGEIAANWITNGITENEVAQVISPKVVSEYSSIIKSQAGTVDTRNILKTYFKPSKVVTGVFYKENNRLLLQGSIMDGLMVHNLISFETIECDPDSPIDCAETLKQRILTYLSMEGKSFMYYEETPPKYKALEYNLSALENYSNDSLHLYYLNKAIEADPNYFEPKIHKIAYYFNLGEFRTADSLEKSIGVNTKLSVRQQNILYLWESLIKGKNDKAYTYQKKEYEYAYLDMPTNMSTMTIALQYVNRPEDIEDIFNKEISMENIVLEKCLQCGYRYYIKGLADVELKRYNHVIDELLPITKTIEDGYLKRPIIMAYIRLGDYDTLKDHFKLWELSSKKSDILNLYMITGNELLLAGENEKAKTYFEKVISNADPETDLSDIASSYYFMKDYKKAQELYEQLNANDPKNIDYIVKLAISNYENGNTSEADRLIKSLDALRDDYQFGTIDYALAQYYAVLKDNSNTFDHLMKAVAEGKQFTPTTFQNDPHFLLVKDSKEFKNVLNYWNQFL